MSQEIDFDNISIDVNDIIKRSAELSGQNREKKDENAPPDMYYHGTGKSELRIIPFFSEMFKTWRFDAPIVYHADFLSDYKLILCPTETFKERDGCSICNAKFEIGKRLGWKTHNTKGILDKYRLNNGQKKTRDFMNILVIKDCEDRGDEKFKRGTYAPGWFGPMFLSTGPYKDFVKKLADPDWADSWHPRNGRVMKLNVSKNAATGYRDTVIDFSPNRTPAGTDEEIKSLLKRAEDMTARMVRPNNELRAIIDARLSDITQEIFGTKIVQVPDGLVKAENSIMTTAGVAVPPMPEKIQSTVPAPKTVQLPVLIEVSGPTSKVDEKGIRLCYMKGFYSSESVECQICDQEFDCAPSSKK
jgi:hypothetical protein